MNKYVKALYYTVVNVLIFLVLFQAVNELKIGYAETTHRLTTYTTMNPNIFSKELDRSFTFFFAVLSAIFQLYFLKEKAKSLQAFLPPILMLLSLFVFYFLNISTLSLLLILASIFLYLKTKDNFFDYANFTISFLVIVEIASLVRWITYPFLKTDFYFDISWVPSKVDKYLFEFLNVTSPYLVTLLVFSWILSIIAEFGARIRAIKLEERKLKIFVEKEGRSEDISKLNIEFSKEKYESIFLSPKFAFAFSFLSLLYLFYYPYFPSVNPLQKLVSVDIMYNYVPNLKAFESLGFTAKGVISLFKGLGFRPFIILSLFFMKVITGFDEITVVKIALLLANFFFVFSVYYSLLITTKNKSLSTASIYFSTFSTHVVVELYAGYLAMLVSVSFIVLSISFLAKAIDEEKLRYLFLAVLFSFLALLSHPWSWLIFALATSVFLPVAILLRHFKLVSYNKRKLLILTAFILTHLFPEVTGMLVSGSQSPVDLVLSVYKSMGGLQNIFLYSSNLKYALQVYVGGFLNNYLIYGLSVVGIAFALRYRSSILNLFITTLLTVSPAFLICNYFVQCRILYFLPVEISSVLGFFELSRLLKGKVSNTQFFLLALLVLMNYSFRSTANLI